MNQHRPTLIARRPRVPARSTVRLRSVPVLRETIKLRGMSIRYVSQEVRKRCGRCSPGMITHFLSDPPRKSTCSAELGRAIEDVLGLPAGLLFLPESSTKEGQDVDTKSAA